MKKFAGDIIIIHICTKITIIWCMVPEISSTTDIMFCHFGWKNPTRKIKILKKVKNNTWRCYYFTNLYHKCQTYDIWFLRYGAWQTEFFVILDHFLPFYLPKNPKNQNFEKLKKCLEISSFYTRATKIMVICYNVPEIWGITDVTVIFHSQVFFALLHP